MKFILLTIGLLLISSGFGSGQDQHVGGRKPIDVNDPTVEKLLSENLERLDSGDSGSFVLISKKKVTQQVVSGIAYQIHGIFKAGERDEEECIVTIWNRVWLQDKNEATKIKAECGEDNTLYKSKGETSEW